MFYGPVIFLYRGENGNVLQWVMFLSFCVVNTKTQVQFEIHSRKESLANILRPCVKGILDDGLQSKAIIAEGSCAGLQKPANLEIFSSGSQNCLYDKHCCRWPYLSLQSWQIWQTPKLKREVLVVFINFYLLPVV